MELNLTLSPEMIDKITRAVEQETETNTSLLQPGSEMKLEMESNLVRQAKKYIDLEAGGLKLLDLEIHGRPARFLLVPDIPEKALRIQFQYRF